MPLIHLPFTSHRGDPLQVFTAGSDVVLCACTSLRTSEVNGISTYAAQKRART